MDPVHPFERLNIGGVKKDVSNSTECTIKTKISKKERTLCQIRVVCTSTKSSIVHKIFPLLEHHKKEIRQK
jgi:hypothetical protein